MIQICADLASVQKALKVVEKFGSPAGLNLNGKTKKYKQKQKRLGQEMWENKKNKGNPLKSKPLHSPVKILGIYASYHENRNKQLDFNLKL